MYSIRHYIVYINIFYYTYILLKETKVSPRGSRICKSTFHPLCVIVTRMYVVVDVLYYALRSDNTNNRAYRHRDDSCMLIMVTNRVVTERSQSGHKQSGYIKV